MGNVKATSPPQYLNVTISTVRSVSNKFKAHCTVGNFPTCGQKRKKMTRDFNERRVRMMNKEPRLTSKQVQAVLQSEGTIVSTRTLRQRLNEKRLHVRIPKKTPLLT